MNVLMVVAVALANLTGLNPILYAEANKRRNSAVFLALLVGYGLAHALTGTDYTDVPLIASDGAARYLVTDYALIILFILFSDEFHSLQRSDMKWVLVIAFGFILSDGVPMMGLTAQWSRLFHCVAQCAWRCAFFSLVQRLQRHAYLVED